MPANGGKQRSQRGQGVCSGRWGIAVLVGLMLPLLLLLSGCGRAAAQLLPTQAAAAAVTPANGGLPPTWTPAPPTLAAAPAPLQGGVSRRLATPTRLPIPTRTPFTPPPTYTPSVTPVPTMTVTPDRLPIGAYGLSEVVPLAAFPRPPGDNGWGIHWIPTVKQEPAVVDRFVQEVVKMHIKWVLFLNDGTNVGDNDYLVERLVAKGVMPVMRIYRSTITPHDGDLGAMVAHYRRKGVYYFQLYNEPNVNIENRQGFANPNHYAEVWAGEARKVLENGGLPGFGALSPGGAYDHYAFLERTLRALQYNGDLELLNKAWLSVHNYHGTRPVDDPEGFLLFRQYDAIIRTFLHRSVPMIGTEGGSYSDDPATVQRLLAFQYGYMQQAEPYFLAFSYWALANLEGGSSDPAWEWQALFRSGYVHPVVTDFFYRKGG